MDKGTEKIVKTLSTIQTVGRVPARAVKRSSAKALSKLNPLQSSEEILKAVLHLLPESSDLLKGDSGFFIELKTKTPGLDIPQHVKDTYPDTVRIALQYQYKHLKVGEKAFKVEVSFSGKYQTITVPYGAILSVREQVTQFAFLPRAG